MFLSACDCIDAGTIGHQSPLLTPEFIAIAPAFWAGITLAASALKVSKSVSNSMVEAFIFLENLFFVSKTTILAVGLVLLN